MEILELKKEDIPKLQKIGRGALATVYKYNDDLAIKIFFEKVMKLCNKDNLFQLSQVKNETCVFPICIANLDGIFQGYAMQYVNGTKLENVIKELDFNLLISAIKKVQESLKGLASYKVLFQDLNSGGIMWSSANEIKIVDTDFFYRNNEVTKEECFRRNLRAFNTIMETILGILPGQVNSIIKFLYSSEEYQQFHNKYVIASVQGQNVSIIELINNVIDIFEKKFGIRPNNIAQMESILIQRTGSENLREGEIPTFKPPTEMVEK